MQEVETTPSQEPSDAASDAWVRLVRAERALVGRIEAVLKGAGFPNLSWYDVLLELKRTSDGRLTPREIEEKVLFEQYNLSRLLDRMEADGLVRRIPYPGDRRRQLVEITDRGRALQQYDLLVRLLDAQLGAPPAPETTELYTRLRGQRPAA